MNAGRLMGYMGGVSALLSGIVSVFTQNPIIYYLTGAQLISGPILIATGIIAIIGGLIALNGSYNSSPIQVIIGGILGLTAPCILSILAVIGGVIMRASRPLAM